MIGRILGAIRWRREWREVVAFHRRVYVSSQGEPGRWLSGCCARCGWQPTAGVHNAAPYRHEFVDDDHFLWHQRIFGPFESV